MFHKLEDQKVSLFHYVGSSLYMKAPLSYRKLEVLQLPPRGTIEKQADSMTHYLM